MGYVATTQLVNLEIRHENLIISFRIRFSCYFNREYNKWPGQFPALMTWITGCAVEMMHINAAI